MDETIEIATEGSAPRDTLVETYIVTAVETIHQMYVVVADDPDQAKARLRRYFQDPAIVAPGIVTPEGEGERVRWLIRGEKKPKK